MPQRQAVSSLAKPFLLLAALCAAPAITEAAWTTNRFDNFFPSWSRQLHDLLEGIWDDFTSATPEPLEVCRKHLPYDNAVGRGPYWTVECMLQEFPEFRKAEAASASVILGLLPSVLSQIGPTTAQLGLLGSRRPVLTLLLALGAPSFSRPTSQGYETSLRDELPFASLETPKQNSNKGSGGHGHTKFHRGRVILTNLLEYTLALAALANVAILTYKLCIWAIESFALGFIWLPAIWVLIAIPVYIVSVSVIYGHFRISPDREGAGVAEWRWYDELTPCHDQPSVKLTPRPWNGRKKAVNALAWFLHFGIVVQGVIGTLALAGLIFISVVDAVHVVLYFVASAVVCKLIIAYELSGLRGKMRFESGQPRSNGSVTGRRSRAAALAPARYRFRPMRLWRRRPLTAQPRNR
ncbi:hypothetical protein PG999_014164 [Apiospora kogelbergensis]|uniref:Uncharacterized protein n=1 Tax=Apiospora kogelbergensis TaxID=1337665 RepID=A0AAW0Q8X3_9PEZI